MSRDLFWWAEQEDLPATGLVLSASRTTPPPPRMSSTRILRVRVARDVRSSTLSNHKFPNGCDSLVFIAFPALDDTVQEEEFLEEGLLGSCWHWRSSHGQSIATRSREISQLGTSYGTASLVTNGAVIAYVSDTLTTWDLQLPTVCCTCILESLLVQISHENGTSWHFDKTYWYKSAIGTPENPKFPEQT